MAIDLGHTKLYKKFGVTWFTHYFLICTQYPNLSALIWLNACCIFEESFYDCKIWIWVVDCSSFSTNKMWIIIFTTVVWKYGGNGIHHLGIEMLLRIIFTFLDITNFLWLVSFSLYKFVIVYTFDYSCVSNKRRVVNVCRVKIQHILLMTAKKLGLWFLEEL